MKDTFPMIPHSFNTNTNTRKIKKRKPNAFILFRNDLIKKYNMKNMKMKDLSKFASSKWKELTENEIKEWEKMYHLNRDHKDLIQNSKDCIIQVVNTSNNSPATINLTQIISTSEIDGFNFICVCGNSIGSNPECSNCSMI
ncbi:hypothetical protein RhiirA5_410373 [Rhizophagus irregularis]|uniref:MATA-HMG n=2 Tax=Rhizophagus irregularis TaxID=588596 RepID=A0A1B1EV96_9GLOM|nr:MATA-HMG [Rhizophagus irregularis]ANQ32736.1 MATA-HMG [Rhizophagus irregularis]ANQ32737.1 MATA-HMG [Rhizophagus irregularis]PKC13643.1 hypothetical protein RhiirA5_410373 [Rhizophagus irregularis]PKC74200.1 hypothetical protein RhiirA1_450244 [Rhizophagus irregularis]